MTARAKIPLKTKLCSALCQLVRYDEAEAEFVRIIPHDKAKAMSEDEILAVFDWHHSPIPKAEDGPDVHWNLEPMEKAPHKQITTKVDVPRIAKNKRVRRKADEHQIRMAAKLTGASVRERPKHRIPSRPFQKGHRPLRQQFGGRP